MNSGGQKTYSIKKKGEYIKKTAPYKASYKAPYKAVQGVQGFPYKAPYKACRTSDSLVRTTPFFNIKYSSTKSLYVKYVIFFSILLNNFHLI